MIDGLSAIMYGANMGAGVMASALSVFFIKGHRHFFPSFIGPLLQMQAPKDFGSRGTLFLHRTYNVKDNSDASRKYDSGHLLFAVMTYFWIEMKIINFFSKEYNGRVHQSYSSVG